MCALYSNALSVVRQQLRRRVGDLILSTAGTPVSGTTYVDTSLRKDADYYNYNFYRAYCYSGSVIGQEREVSDYATVGSVTFAPAFGATIGAGDLFELGHIFQEHELRGAINLAIEHIGKNYLIDSVDSTAVTLAADTYEYSLPASIVSIHKITVEDTAGSGTFEEGDVIDFRDWRLISPRKLKLNENYSITAGKDLRIEGKSRQGTVGSDTAIIYLPPAWVVEKAITFLPQNEIQSNGLEDVYKSALVLSQREPRSYPEPLSREVIE